MKTKTPNVSGRSAWLRDNITKYFSFSAIIILLVALSLTQDNFLGTSNLKNLLRDTAPLMIMSAGMTMVLLFGSIDLSMGAVCSVSNVTYIHLMLAFQDSFSNPFLTSLAAMAVSLAFGLASGLALGIIHVKLKVPSFIASLGFMSLWQSVALLITQNPESVPKALWGTVEWYKIAFGVVGLPLIVAIAIILFIHCVTRYTPSGRTIFAIGGNERTARVAGMGVDKTKILVFAINGVLAALAGIFLAANLRSSAPTIGDPFYVVFAFGRRYPMRAMAKIQIMRVPFIGWILGKGGVFGVDRGHADMHAVKTALKLLKDGNKLLMFPEGTRVREGEDVAAKTGAAMFATRTGVPIVPMIDILNMR